LGFFLLLPTHNLKSIALHAPQVTVLGGRKARETARTRPLMGSPRTLFCEF